MVRSLAESRANPAQALFVRGNDDMMLALRCKPVALVPRAETRVQASSAPMSTPELPPGPANLLDDALRHPLDSPLLPRGQTQAEAPLDLQLRNRIADDSKPSTATLPASP